jgi:peptidoglycan/LPS O-acetylase OafA/YrhL
MHKEVAHLDTLWVPNVMGARDWRTVGVLVVSCLAAAWFMYVVVERPFLALRDRRRVVNVDKEVLVEPAL